jgi:hypothetical protein
VHTKEVQDTAGVAPLVVVPGHQLHKVFVEGDTCLGIEDGRVGVAVHVGRNNVILSVSQDSLLLLVAKLIEDTLGKLALEVTLSGSLDSFLDLVVGSALLDADS